MNKSKEKIKELDQRLESLERALYDVLKMISGVLGKNQETLSELEERIENIEYSGKF